MNRNLHGPVKRNLYKHHGVGTMAAGMWRKGLLSFFRVRPALPVAVTLALATAACGQLVVEKEADQELVPLGGQVGFTITVTNVNPIFTSVDVTLEDQLPPQLQWQLSPTHSGCTIDSNQLLTCDLGNIPPLKARDVACHRPGGDMRNVCQYRHCRRGRSDQCRFR